MGTLAMLLLLAAPGLTRGEQSWVLSNDHLALTFDLSQGGWLRRLADRQGRVYLEAGAAYTDSGFYPDRRTVTTRGVTTAVVAAEERPEAVTVVTTGRLQVGGQPSDLGYELRTTLGSSRTVQLLARLSCPRGLAEATGFLAAVFNLSGLTEWFAETVDGRVNELAAEQHRGFQSALLPFAPDHPTLGLVYADGRLLRATATARSGPLSNVFLHHTGPGQAALFFAWLDAGASAPWPPAEVWELALALEAD